MIEILETFENTEQFYYKIRSADSKTLTVHERAARLIYLNKTCFNGLFRVNKKGNFNVPFGKREGSFFNKINLLNASRYLQNAQIDYADYKLTLNKYARKGDFVFLDPPYHPIGKFSDFKRYTKEFFYEKDQIDLAGIFRDLVDRGCFVMLTNSDHPLIYKLYEDFKIISIPTKRLISRDPNTRTGTDLLVLGGL